MLGVACARNPENRWGSAHAQKNAREPGEVRVGWAEAAGRLDGLTICSLQGSHQAFQEIKCIGVNTIIAAWPVDFPPDEARVFEQGKMLAHGRGGHGQLIRDLAREAGLLGGEKTQDVDPVWMPQGFTKGGQLFFGIGLGGERL